MTLVEFLENRYQELTLENDGKSKEKFNIRIDSEIKATHEILTHYRALVKSVMVPKILYDFCLVQMGKKKEPQPVILNKLKREMKEKEKREATALSL